MSGYIIVNCKILEKIRIEELGPRSFPVLYEHCGELVFASNVEPLEGSPFSTQGTPHSPVIKFKTTQLDVESLAGVVSALTIIIYPELVVFQWIAVLDARLY